MIKLVFIGLTAVFLILLLKSAKPEFTVLISIAACVMILLYCVGMLGEILGRMETLFSYASLPSGYVSLLLKILGVTYLAEFGTSLCQDAGQTAIAGQLELAGKLIVISISLPVILSVFEEIIQLF